MVERAYLAVDLGAESGRVVAGLFDGRHVRIEPVHRFPNGPVIFGDSLHWNVMLLWEEVQKGLALAAERFAGQAASIGVATWGVDFALLGRGDVLLGNPYHYRDPRTEGMLDEAFRLVPREQIFAQTGIQFMPINTLYQLLAMVVDRSPLLAAAETLLLMPDLFNWLLTGRKGVEFTNATTTQCYNPSAGDWARELLERLSIPTAMLPEVIQPGTRLGPLRDRVAKRVGLEGVAVVAPATHDTGSAVAAVPASRASADAPSAPPDWCYISSGTWSLMGIELPRAETGPLALEYNFTNEGGVDGTYRLLKNIMGLWLVQQCRRAWAAAGRDLAYADLAQRAETAGPAASWVDPDDPGFLNPPDMPEAIRQFCLRTNQPVPDHEGAVVRCALESLALKYRFVLERIERLTGARIATLHVVGGGAQNELLCRLTADACGRPVVAGPVEATALGNVLVQARAAGELASLADIRECVRRSFELRRYEPADTAAWQEKFQRFVKLIA